MSEEVQRNRYNLVLEQLKEKTGKILDIGCQNGEFCSLISQNGFIAYGIDIDSELIEKAKKEYPQIKFESCNNENGIPFPDEFFDVVWAGDIIEHICKTDIFINEINRVLKMGGLLILSTPMHSKIKNIGIALFRFEKHFNPEFPHYRFYTLKSLRNVLEKRGFRISNVKYIGRFWPVYNNMLVLSEKIENKLAYSLYH
jgi:2-polyprenyl-3-methyl-5-hydroxy-6-metoxy-1,4-benzoquinol methylase